MSNPLREAIEERVARATYDSGSIMTRSKAVSVATDAILDAFIASLPDTKQPGTYNALLNPEIYGYIKAVRDVRELLQSAKSTSKTRIVPFEIPDISDDLDIETDGPESISKESE